MAESLGRLELCRDILKLRASKAKVADHFERHARVLVNNRIRAIRRVLLKRPGKSLLDELLSPSMAEKGLIAAAESAKSGSDSDKRAAVVYLRSTVDLLQRIESTERLATLKEFKDKNDYADAQKAINSLNKEASDFDGLVDASIERGSFGLDIRVEAIKALAEVEGRAVSAASIATVDAELGERLNSAGVMLDLLKEKLAIAMTAMQSYENGKLAMAARGATLQEILDGRESFVDVYMETRKAYDDFHALNYAPLNSQVSEAIKRANERLNEPFEVVGQRVIDAAMAGSSITPDQAKDWAAKQDITAAAKGRLKKIGYPMDKVVSDMADFYRMTGGRLNAVKIHSKGDQRANATDIETHGKVGVIHLDGSFNKRTLWHELGHHLEADPVLKSAAGALIKKRSVDGKFYTLRNLTGNKGYRSDEIAYKDSFFSEYIGKIYRDGITEVFSMGVETMSDPMTLGKRMAKDPETLEFVMGFVGRPMTELETAHKTLRNQFLELNQEADGEKANAVDEMTRKLAVIGGEIIPDADTSWLKDGTDTHWTSGKQLGRLGEYWIFSDKVKNWETGRMTTGFRIYKLEERNGPMGERGYKSLSSGSIASKNKELLSAAHGGYRKTGAWPSLSQLSNEGYLSTALKT